MSGSKHILLFTILLTFFSTLFSPFSTQKVEASVLGGAIGAITAAHAIPHVPTGDTVGNLVMTTLKLAAKEVAQQMIEQMVRDTINWVNNGFNGNPAYVTNPERYFTDIANGVAGDFIHDSRLGFLCSPFQAQITASLRFTYDSVYAQPRPAYACTATGIWGNIKGFQDNFEGGWDSWFQITQNDANNPYGAGLAAQVALSQEVQNKLGLAKDEYSINKGFLSFKDSEGNIKTPGTLIEDQLKDTLGSGFTQLVNAKEFDDLIDAFMAQLIRKTVFPPKNQGLFSNTAITYTNSGGNTPSQNPISCAADTQSAVVGDRVSWSASTNLPPTTKIEYIWNGEGAANKSDITGSVTVVYATDGQKTMTLSANVSDIIFDANTGQETLTNARTIPPVTCSGTVKVVKYPPLKLLSCSASSLQQDYEQPVTWTATFTGGSGKIRSIKWDGDQPNPPQCNPNNGSCAPAVTANIWPQDTQPKPLITWPYIISNGSQKITTETFSTASSTMTSTVTRVYYKNNSVQLGNVSANITVIDEDLNVAALEKASCGSIFIRP